MKNITVKFKTDSNVGSFLRNGRCKSTALELSHSCHHAYISSVGARGIHTGHIGFPKDSDSIYEIANAFLELADRVKADEQAAKVASPSEGMASHIDTTDGVVEVYPSSSTIQSTHGYYAVS